MSFASNYKFNRIIFFLLKSYELQRREGDAKRYQPPDEEKRKPEEQRRKELPKRQLPEDGMCHFC